MDLSGLQWRDECPERRAARAAMNWLCSGRRRRLERHRLQPEQPQSRDQRRDQPVDRPSRRWPHGVQIW